MNAHTNMNGDAVNGASNGYHQSDKALSGVEDLRKALGNGALEQLRSLRRTLPVLVEGQDDLRDELLAEARQVMLDIETPWHTLQRTLWLSPWEGVTADIAVDMGLFRTLAKAQRPLTASAIATQCNAELLWTQRLLRCLNALGAVSQQWTSTEPLYTANNITRAYVGDWPEATTRCITEFWTPDWYKLPKVMRENGFKSLTSGTDTTFNKTWNAPGKHVWEILGDEAKEFLEVNGIFMTKFNSNHAQWFTFYPAEERLVRGAEKDSGAVFMVDVGGFTGSQLVIAREQFPEAPGKFVLLDLPSALPKTPPPGIEFCGHDFFKPYPGKIRGARLYYMRMIGHDWSQDALIRILTNIKEAMQPGYSKLIINDWIVPERDPHRFMCSQDLVMMHLGGGEERSEARHREAIEAAGLKMTGVFHAGDKISEGVIECEVPYCGCACDKHAENGS